MTCVNPEFGLNLDFPKYSDLKRDLDELFANGIAVKNVPIPSTPPDFFEPKSAKFAGYSSSYSANGVDSTPGWEAIRLVSTF